MSSSMVAKRPPTPVSPITPATMPAAAQTAMSCITSFAEPASARSIATSVSVTEPATAAGSDWPCSVMRWTSAVPSMMTMVAAIPIAAARKGE